MKANPLISSGYVTQKDQLSFYLGKSSRTALKKKILNLLISTCNDYHIYNT